MTENKRVAIDVEGVLADIHRVFIREFNEEYDATYSFEDIDTSRWEWVGELGGFSTFMSITDEAWETPETIPPLESGIGPEIRRLADAGYEVDIVTARQGVDEHIQWWLSDHDITDYDQFHAVSHTKAEMGYTFYIDDRPGLADELSEGQHQYVRSHPWNRSISPHPRATPVSTVHAAVDAIVTKP